MKKLILTALIFSCFKAVNNITTKNKNKNEALVRAINDNNTEEAIKLINEGANINYISNGKSVLDIALDNENLDVIKILIDKDIEISKNNIVRIYDVALDDFNYDIIDIIKDKYKLEEGSVDNNKYFLFLCYTSNSEYVEKFIKENNINPKEVKDKINNNALIIGAAGNKVDIFKTFIDKYRLNFRSKNDKGITPFIAASKNNCKKIVKLLLKEGIEIDSKTISRSTALMYCSKKGYIEILKLLIKGGANINEKNKNGYTSLGMAVNNDHAEVVKELIKEGANVNDRNTPYYSLLMLASKKGQIEIVKELIKGRASINERDRNGYTALMIASSKGHKEVVKILLEKGANINDKDSFYELNALTIALKNNHMEIFKILIEKGINLYHKDKLGKTVLIYIIEQLNSAKENFERSKLIEMAYITIRKMAEDYINVFISLNKNINTPQKIKDEIHNHINLLYSLQNLPAELFEKIIIMLN